jgi:hypothetical protein
MSTRSTLALEAEADDLRQLRAHFVLKLEGVQKQLDKRSDELQAITSDSAEIERLLDSHKGELKFRDVVERAGSNTAHKALDEQAHSIDEDLSKAEQKAVDLKAKLDALQDPFRVKEIVGRFRQFYSHFAIALSVPSSLQAHSKAPQSKPSAGGSGGPRAVLAYYFALAHTAEEYSDGCIPPLTVDSPHQQAQDDIRRPQVTEFIFTNRPTQQQMIVGLEDPPPASVVFGPDDHRIDLTEQFHVLTSDQYEEVFTYIEPLWRAAEASLNS